MLQGLGRQGCSWRMRFLVLWLPLPLVLLFLRAFKPQGKPTADKPFTCIAGLLEKKKAVFIVLCQALQFEQEINLHGLLC